ncbi:MAG TPA: DUF3631 domain-containing protein [Acetobacteraceae bacterium]|nr:DUF3631 domain-containing protein [Acetobacteraceae bacterium]
MTDIDDDRADLEQRIKRAKTAAKRRKAAQPKPNGEAPADDVDIDAVVSDLAHLSLADYERMRRTTAERLNLRASILDRLVQAERDIDNGDSKGQGRPVDLPPPTPWPDAVNGAVLLHVLSRYFARHLILPPGAHRAMALWTVHCHAYEVFAFTPRLQFKSPVKGAGKSTALELLKGVVPKPMETETVTQAFLFRVIELARPTVLLDEADTYLQDDDDLRGMVNAGFKPGATAGRCVGEDQTPRLFSCHAPVALAAIGSLPGTIEDRAIRIMMKRRSRAERIWPIEDITRRIGGRLQAKAARWVRDHRAELQRARPDMGILFNRPADRWRALYAVAEVAGEPWPRLAREAMQALAAASDDEAESLGEKLLGDAKRIFEGWPTDPEELIGGPIDELPTAAIVEKLLAMQDRPWAEMGRARRPMTTTRFTQMVSRFRITRHRLTDPMTGKGGAWGYRRTDFDEAWSRYLDA